MDSSVKMMEIETENTMKESTQTMRANGEVNGSCDDGSMDTCSSPTSSQQPHDSEKSNDSSRFTEIQKVPTSEVPVNVNDETDEPMEVTNDNKQNQRLSEDGGDGSRGRGVDDDDEDDDDDVDDDDEVEEEDEHTGDTERSETTTSRQQLNNRPTNASTTSVADSVEEHDMANGTEEDDIEDAISVDSGTSDEEEEEAPIESVNIGDSNSEDDESDHSEPIELHESDDNGPTRHSDDGDDPTPTTLGGGRTTIQRRIVDNNKDTTNREQKVKLSTNNADDSGDVTIVENDNSGKSNGEVCSSPEVQEICDLSKDKDSSSETTPKKKKKPQTPQQRPEAITPRRSSRNLNKQKSYIEPRDNDIVDDDDIEEITPDDPLGLSDHHHHHHHQPPSILQHHHPQQSIHHHHQHPHNRPRPASMSGGTIVVKDTKRLVEIANTSKPSMSSHHHQSLGGSGGMNSGSGGGGGKKEPTLVIIDTNSILSGRGPVPVSHHNKSSGNLSTSYSVLPMALPAQGVYPANMRATITPIPMPQKQIMQQQQQQHQAALAAHAQQQAAAAAAAAAANILPSLTDDMYVVEAPSFIVPYVYEKPPIKPLKEFVVQYGKEVDKCEKEAADKKKTEKTKKKHDDDDDYEVSENSDDDDSKKENGTSDDSNAEPPTKVTDKIVTDTSKGADYEELLDAKPITPETAVKMEQKDTKSTSYFDNPLGKFFFNIGFNLVQEFVQTDLLKQQKRKRDREGSAPNTNMAIASLIKNLEFSKENNEPYHMEMKKCDYCSFRTESALALAHHLETPHMRNYVYRCNFCPLEVRSPHDILFHMEAEHNTRGRLERAPSFHQCPNCPYEDNQKGKLSRHMIACAKKFKPEKNMEPPADWEPPAKIPRLSRGKQVALVPGAAPYPTFTQNKNIPILPQRLATPSSQAALMRNRGGRPNLIGKVPIRPGMVYRPNTPGQVLVPTTYQYGGNQIYTVMSGNVLGLEAESLTFGSASIQPLTVRTQEGNNFTIQTSSSPSNRSSAIPSKLVHQPSISITPLPRQSSTNNQSNSSSSGGGGGNASGGVGGIPAMPMPSVKPGDPAAGKATFVICEICDGYIKDLEQLRNHMQWIHKVKIHPKMIYNRPPLNCQKCQFRFFTDQGLERHLLGSHGLVTSSMQEAANKGKDAGRCPVCGRVYQWKLLNHVARDHKITLKPAHLSYKCTVCTATFGMYKQFENHVYSAHSVVAKRVIEKKNNVTSSSSASSRNNDSLLKPLKINDEITIIPQPAKPKPGTSSSNQQRSSSDSSKAMD